MMLQDLQQTVLQIFLNLREMMIGTLFYCKTLEKKKKKGLRKQCTVHLPYNLYLRTFY